MKMYVRGAAALLGAALTAVLVAQGVPESAGSAVPTADASSTSAATPTASAALGALASPAPVSSSTVSPMTSAPTSSEPAAEASSSKAVGLIVTYESASSTDLDRATVLDALDGVATGAVAIAPSTARTSVVSFDDRVSAASLDAAAATLAEERGVASVVPDRVFSTLESTSVSAHQWNFDDRGSTTGDWSIRIPGAWATTTGSSSVIVADLDTGTTAHPGTNGIYTTGYDFISDAKVARDSNGRDADPTDEGDWTTTESSSWHGTAVSSVIAGQASDPLDISGVAPRTLVEPIRAIGSGGGAESDIIAGITWAAGGTVKNVPVNAHPADVINLSLGGDGLCDTAMQSAISFAIGRGIPVVAAAGNSSEDVSQSTPANCDGVISVAASTRSGGLADYSNSGSDIALAAPGGDTDGATETEDLLPVASNPGTTTEATATSADYYLEQGTSFAAPEVSGTIALLLAERPGLSVADATAALTDTATPFAAGSSCAGICGVGVLNAAAAVVAVAPDSAAAATRAAAAESEAHASAAPTPTPTPATVPEPAAQSPAPIALPTITPSSASPTSSSTSSSTTDAASRVSARATKTTLRAAKKRVTFGTRAVLRIRVSSGATPKGTVVIRDKKRVIGKQKVKAGAVRYLLPKRFAIGTHRLRATFVPTNRTKFETSTSKKTTLVVRRHR